MRPSGHLNSPLQLVNPAEGLSSNGMYVDVRIEKPLSVNNTRSDKLSHRLCTDPITGPTLYFLAVTGIPWQAPSQRIDNTTLGLERAVCSEPVLVG